MFLEEISQIGAKDTRLVVEGGVVKTVVDLGVEDVVDLREISMGRVPLVGMEDLLIL